MTIKFNTVEDRRRYNRAHDAVRRVRGKAVEWNCVCCDKMAKEWALIHGADLEDVFGYQPMCYRCHQIYDNKWDDEERAKISAWSKRQWAEATPEQRAKMLPDNRGRSRPDMIGNSYRWG